MAPWSAASRSKPNRRWWSARWLAFLAPMITAGTAGRLSTHLVDTLVMVVLCFLAMVASTYSQWCGNVHHSCQRQHNTISRGAAHQVRFLFPNLS
jgi:hypothetical protein